jgi:hypothetical protein
VGGGAVGDGPAPHEARFRAVYERLGRLGHPTRPYDQAWDSYRRLREAFYPELAAATRLLLVPMEFRHQTSRLDLSGPPGQ